jgi:DNA polymerase I
VYVQGAAADGIVTARLIDPVRQAAYDRLTKRHPFSVHGVTGDEAWRLVEREQIINRWALVQSCRGLAVDFEYLDDYKATTMQARDEAERQLAGLGITPGNGNHLTKYLESQGALPEDYPRTGKTKAPSAQAKHLEMLAHPVAQLFVDQKRIVKITDDYLQKVIDLSVNGRIHPVAHILKAATGRMSMADPPLQQFSGPARGIVVADSGRSLTSIDWSAIEPCIAANVAGEWPMIEHYENGGDLYEGVASLAGVVRKTAKVILLAGLYGEGRVKLAADLKITEDEAVNLQNQIFNGIPQVWELIQNLKQTARNHKLICTISGRIIPIPETYYDGRLSVSAHRGVNYFVQGSAWDVLAESMIRIINAGLGDGVHLLMHDELVVDSEVGDEIRRHMERPPDRLCRMARRIPKLRTDLQVMGQRWASV